MQCIGTVDMRMQDTTPQYLSTAEAAQILGLSTTLIQSLVDRNELSGWKTRGGHRRIALQSVLEYQANAQVGRPSGHGGRQLPKVMVAIESPALLHQVRSQSASWQLPFDVLLVDSITAALLELPQARPDLLVVEMTMPRSQQEKTLSALQDFSSRARSMSVTLVTEESGLVSAAERPAVPIQVASGPLTATWLHAFMVGVRATWRI